mmetsp:Transcript_12848/g.49213  ORF Transcript_12848/g.49213 Transcript_12848/m.49213 type:complete len:210 (+) Transcript_12848:1462-2091(+)
MAQGSAPSRRRPARSERLVNGDDGNRAGLDCAGGRNVPAGPASRGRGFAAVALLGCDAPRWRREPANEPNGGGGEENHKQQLVARRPNTAAPRSKRAWVLASSGRPCHGCVPPHSPPSLSRLLVRRASMSARLRLRACLASSAACSDSSPPAGAGGAGASAGTPCAPALSGSSCSQATALGLAGPPAGAASGLGAGGAATVPGRHSRRL